MARAHWLDRGYSALTSQARLFARGFGDLERLAPLREAFLSPAPPSPIRISLGPERRWFGLGRLEGHFESPSARFLPKESRTARFELLLPKGESSPVCLFLASTGEQGFGFRRRLCLPLVLGGLGALILEAPYYGRRRPPGQQSWVLGSLSDQLAMGVASVEEARALLGWLREQGHQQVGATGYSMGGSMAAYAAARTPFPVCTAVLAAGDSAAPIFTQGFLSRRVEWSALGEGGEASARKRVAEIFESVSLLHLPPPSDPRRAVIVGCEGDGYIDVESVRRLHQHWQGSQLRWLSGGHVTGLLGHGWALRAAIRDAFGGVPAA
ncbi:MAG: alpha/beta hydrolase family protein [Myxococcaceae bacterium]